MIDDLSLITAFGSVAGAPFAIVWFNQTAFGPGAQPGDPYGFYSDPAFVLPSADNQAALFASRFGGSDPPKPMQYALVPEPGLPALSGATLTLAGFRRRRAAR